MYDIHMKGIRSTTFEAAALLQLILPEAQADELSIPKHLIHWGQITCTHRSTLKLLTDSRMFPSILFRFIRFMKSLPGEHNRDFNLMPFANSATAFKELKS